jgi:fructokinase
MIIVAGENVVDLIPAGDGPATGDGGLGPSGGGLLRAALGGGPANTAVAAARLGAPVAFAARFGHDAPGRAFRDRMRSAGVDLRYATDLPNPSAMALATIDRTGAATYDFWLDNAADFTATPLPTPGAGDVQHIGSLAAYWPPGADVIEQWIDRSRATVTFDVNLRPIVLAAQTDAVARLDRLVRRVDVIKASDDDLRMAYPSVEPETTARTWLDQAGCALVVLTLGAHGAVALTRDGARVEMPAPRIAVVDTIGAGDAAMGALLSRIAADGLDGVLGDLDGTLRFVVTVAALACTRAGAYAPAADELVG